jgi:hypothetical protein
LHVVHHCCMHLLLPLPIHAAHVFPKETEMYITLYRKIQQTRSQRELKQICSSFTYLWSTMNILIS